MQAEALARVLALPDDARVLDVGGWAAPLNRADWVIDVMPFETRGAIASGGVGPLPARFGRDSWVLTDLCSHQPWPFEDDYFDVAVCTFTLEDVRDPIRVCEEMSRVARAGYVEVPSLLDELTWLNPEVSGGPWVGHAHHRWLCSAEQGELVFLTKFHSLHARSRLRIEPRRAKSLSEAERVLSLWWEGSLAARERLTIDSYPFEELEAAVEARFPRSALEIRALELRDRLERRLRRAGTR
jgi:SAM-dependent methyltransferase